MRKVGEILKKYAAGAAFVLLLAFFFIMNRAAVPQTVLESERRPPASFPRLTGQSFADASFMDGFDKWAQDNFALREPLRVLRAETVFHVFFETDKDGLYIGKSGAGKFEKIDEKNWTQTIEKINKVDQALSDGTLADGGLNVYAAFIPDKSLYAGRYLPGFDAYTAHGIFDEKLDSDIEAIDLTGAVSAGDFYKTDIHWSQPYIGGVTDALERAMCGDGSSATQRDGSFVSFAPSAPPAPFAAESAGAFKGVYAGQLALPMAPDELLYVSNSYIDSAVVTYLDPKTASMIQGQVYYPEALTDGGDPYDFFLNGPQPLVILENPSPQTGRALYLFRDSFGSSLAPLMLPFYDRVVLIDLRYIDIRALPEYVDFDADADVLFLYSSQILNNPSVLLVN